MAHACVGMAQRAVTAEITVRYQKAVETGARVRARGMVEEARGRVLSTRGWLYDAEGLVVAEATGRFLATTRIPHPGRSLATNSE
jgi:acyl-coenzyme A thioesterase PaaI-like protein